MSTTPHRSSSPRFPSGMPSCEEAVEWLAVDIAWLPATAEVARFRSNDGVTEYHVTVRLAGEGDAARQYQCLMTAYEAALDAVGIDPSSAVFRRVFCSDVVNQKDLFETPGPLSLVGQSPLPASRFAIWAWHLCGPQGALETTVNGPTLSCRRGPLTHHWTAGIASPGHTDSHEQSRRVLADHDSWFQSAGMNTADHLVRTWWFVQNIDADYQGLVDARRNFFDAHGLTADTHYIASTGIAGSHHDPAARVFLDSYAIGGLQAAQVKHLNAPDHLCPTHAYGVTFERATAISYSDRRHIFISGTASIDHHGKILHPGDVLGQLDRTLANIDALLARTGANLCDLASIIVYLRDPADGSVIEATLREKLGSIPFCLVHAPVCRPGWLIEIEGIAVVPANHPDLPAF